MADPRRRDLEGQRKRRRDCGKPAGGKWRCGDCRATAAANRRYRRALSRLGQAMLPYLRDAEQLDCEAIIPEGEVRRVLGELDRTS